LIPGVHLVHKEVGESSFDVVRRFKHEAWEEGLKKFALGHGGTLDPFADGLLLVLAGQGTRLMELMHPLPKTYLARIVWGSETDTCDHQGLVTAEGPLPAPEALEGVLEAFLGWTDQIPPATCAKKIDGEAAYKKAHRGEVFEMRPSRVFLHEARWLAPPAPGESLLELTCRGGFYVRSLARDLGRKLGSPAHLSALTRTAIGPWQDPGIGARQVVHGTDLIPWCTRRVLTADEADHLLHGRPVPMGELLPPTWVLPGGFPDPEAPLAGFHDGKLVALLREKEGALWTCANLRGGL
jgi:tRNA pseudouridine55 synthase